MKFPKIKFVSLMAGFTLLSAPAWAADYSQYTTDELHEMRGKMQNVSQEERKAFRHEWQERMREMPVEERGRYLQKSGRNYSDDDDDGRKNRNSYRHGHGRDGDDDRHYGRGPDDDGSRGRGRGRGNRGGGGRGR